MNQKIFLLMALLLLLSSILIGCTDEKEEKVKTEQYTNEVEQTEQENKGGGTVQPKAFSNYERYLSYIKQTPNFELYYRVIFDMNELPNGKAEMPIADLRGFYEKLQNEYDYYVIKEIPLTTYGPYTNDLQFVEGYSEKLTDEELQHLANVGTVDWNGNETFSTALKALQIGPSNQQQFEKLVAQGRYFEKRDYTLAKATERIPVILGSHYQGVYKIGDLLKLELVSQQMEFEVIGFYQEDVTVGIDIAGNHQIDLNTMITMPAFVPTYTPKSESEKYQVGFLLGEWTSGYIKLSTSSKDLSDDIYDQFVVKFEQLAESFHLKKAYTIPYWPVTIIWP